MGPVWLIAEREFKAYVSTLSFWVALAVGPATLAIVLAVAAMLPSGTHQTTVAIKASTPALARSAAAAVAEAARLEGRPIVLVAAGGPAATRVDLADPDGRAIRVRFAGAPLLSPEGEALVGRTLERDDALAGPGAPRATSVFIRRGESRAPSLGHPDVGAMARFSLVMMLWLVLTGSLGMLLQAVVRERANKALESLLAAARPWQIVAGKLAGVGAVSLLVLGVWLASAALGAHAAPAGVAGEILGRPVALFRAGLIYVLAFAFYGSVTVAVSAGARDSAIAQNLARPMFAILLLAFFISLAGGVGAAPPAWLAFAPPFTPFVLLLLAPGAMTPLAQFAALVSLALGTGLAGLLAVRGVSLSPAGPPFARLLRA